MQLDMEQLDADTLLHEANARVATLAQDRELQLSVETSPYLPAFYGDRDKLTRTLVNLLDSAINITPPGCGIKVSAWFVPRPGRTDALLFEVADTGSHDSLPAQPKLPSGPNLTFCQAVVQAHGGRIWVETETGHGNRFHFALPLHASVGKASNAVASV